MKPPEVVVPQKPYVVPSTARRDLLLGIGIGAAILAFAVFVLFSASKGIVGTTLNGKIVAKNYTPFKEEQVTFGKGGVDAREIDGEYEFECEVKGSIYLVPVTKETYQKRNVGDFFLFPKPKE